MSPLTLTLARLPGQEGLWTVQIRDGWIIQLCPTPLVEQ